MRRFSYLTIILLGLTLLTLSGCTSFTAPEKTKSPASPELTVTFPVEEYAARRTSKTFGEYIQDRFRGYHVGDDVEFVDVAAEVPVVAIAEGSVEEVEWVSGYGGLIRMKHTIENDTVTALYGHVDLKSAEVEVGDSVKIGQFLANLGDHESQETDGERKHLHFGLYRGSERRMDGYEATPEAVSTWLNPQDFFAQKNLEATPKKRRYDATTELGGNFFKISFDIPVAWEVEYIPSLEALNLYTLSGKGLARERSQILIRYFDANQFLTLNTVTVYSTEELTVAQGTYTARRYDIEKKPNIASFKDQPSWRNQRHFVTDFRGADEGRMRYYVIAARPDLNPTVYEKILESMEIEK